MMRIFLAIAAFLTMSTGAFAQEEGVRHAEPWGLGLVGAGSPQMADLISFHNLLLVIITVITLFVLALLIWVMVRFNERSNPTPSRTSHNTLIEVVWTIVPILILLVIAVPSFKLLINWHDVEDSEMTLKVTGYQWYWGYEYPDNGGFSFDAIMKEDAELADGEPRLLTTDNLVVLPVDTKIKVQVTAADVGHSWAMPAAGGKIDAWPGHLNELPVQFNETGMYYGQCSELCGRNHGFMPITVKVVSKEEFAAWVEEAKVQFGAAESDVKLADASRR